jgi:DNA-binding NarL/FixJ family response regulator
LQTGRGSGVLGITLRGLDALARRAGLATAADRGRVLWLRSDLSSPMPPASAASQRHSSLDYQIATLVPELMQDVEAVLREQHPRLLVADVHWCERVGTATLRRLRRRLPHVDWVLCWDEVSPRWLEILVCTGARGAVTADVDEIELARTFDAVAAGEVWLPRRVLQWLYATIVTTSEHTEAISTQPFSSSLPVGDSRLTDREAEALDLLRQGLTNREIALRLGVSINTVKKHLANTYEKRGVRSRRQMLG